jgi:hypothetical protein
MFFLTGAAQISDPRTVHYAFVDSRPEIDEGLPGLAPKESSKSDAAAAPVAAPSSITSIVSPDATAVHAPGTPPAVEAAYDAEGNITRAVGVLEQAATAAGAAPPPRPPPEQNPEQQQQHGRAGAAGLCSSPSETSRVLPPSTAAAAAPNLDRAAGASVTGSKTVGVGGGHLGIPHGPSHGPLSGGSAAGLSSSSQAAGSVRTKLIKKSGSRK